jgi:hypothetical protein
MYSEIGGTAERGESEQRVMMIMTGADSLTSNAPGFATFLHSWTNLDIPPGICFAGVWRVYVVSELVDVILTIQRQ